MKGSNFIFDCVNLLQCKCYRTIFKPRGLYINSPDWIKSKKVAINPINKKENICFQKSVTVVPIYEEIKKEPQRITKNKLLIDKYNWKE